MKNKIRIIGLIVWFITLFGYTFTHILPIAGLIWDNVVGDEPNSYKDLMKDRKDFWYK